MQRFPKNQKPGNWTCWKPLLPETFAVFSTCFFLTSTMSSTEPLFSIQKTWTSSRQAAPETWENGGNVEFIHVHPANPRGGRNPPLFYEALENGERTMRQTKVIWLTRKLKSQTCSLKMPCWWFYQGMTFWCGHELLHTSICNICIDIVFFRIQVPSFPTFQLRCHLTFRFSTYSTSPSKLPYEGPFLHSLAWVQQFHNSTKDVHFKYMLRRWINHNYIHHFQKLHKSSTLAVSSSRKRVSARWSFSSTEFHWNMALWDARATGGMVICPWASSGLTQLDDQQWLFDMFFGSIHTGRPCLVFGMNGIYTFRCLVQ